MHAALRAFPIVVCGCVFTAVARGQPEPLPSIFAPRPNSPASEKSSSPVVRSSPAPLSSRTRSLLEGAATRVLAEVVAFEVPGGAPAIAGVSADGATVMKAVTVEAKTLKDSDLRVRVPELYRFGPAAGDPKTGIAGGVTAPLYHTFIGNKELQIDFNVLNGAGRGADHGRDFTRVEIAFRLKF
jgi:hypothetical protein